MREGDNRPLIARDTGKPLVVLGGYRVNANGGLMRDVLRPAPRPTATADDVLALQTKGEAWLKEHGLYGVLDRLTASGLVS